MCVQLPVLLLVSVVAQAGGEVLSPLYTELCNRQPAQAYGVNEFR